MKVIFDSGILIDSKIDRGYLISNWKVEKSNSFFGFIAENDWEVKTFRGSNLNINLYITKGNLEKNADLAEYAGEVFNFYNNSFGPPRAATDINYVDSTIGYIRDNFIPLDKWLIPHETAHRWWPFSFEFDFKKNLNWLSEGFAEYSSMLFQEHIKGKESLKKFLLYRQTEYIKYIFEGRDILLNSMVHNKIVYSKGALVLHNLRYIVGDKTFFDILRHYLKTNSGKRINNDSFKIAAEEIYGKPLDWFFDQWINRTGLPEYDLQYDITTNGNTFTVNGRIIQLRDLYTMPIDIEISGNSQSFKKRIWVYNNEKSKEFSFNAAFKVEKVVFDPENGIPRFTPETINKAKYLIAVKEGDELQKNGEYMNALEKYDEAIKISPKNKFDLITEIETSKVYFKIGKYTEFKKKADKILSYGLSMDELPYITIRYPKFYLYYGNLYDMENKRDKAIEMYKKAKEILSLDDEAIELAEKYLKEPFK
jgi:tetratricopeptide (TPR) repeat protein